MNDAPVPGQLPTGAPFGAWERALAFRYLKARRRNGGIALIAWISFIAVTLAVAALIIIMSVMNGFRSEIVSRMVGFNGHIYVQGPATGAATRDTLISRIRAVPGVVQVVPVEVLLQLLEDTVVQEHTSALLDQQWPMLVVVVAMVLWEVVVAQVAEVPVPVVLLEQVL